MIREAIKKALERLGKNMTWLFEKSGVRYASITGYLKGRNELRSDNLELLFKALDISLISLSTSEKVILKDALRPLFDKKHTGMISSRLIVGMYESFKLGEDFIITIKNDYWDAFGEEY